MKGWSIYHFMHTISSYRLPTSLQAIKILWAFIQEHMRSMHAINHKPFYSIQTQWERTQKWVTISDFRFNTLEMHLKIKTGFLIMTISTYMTQHVSAFRKWTKGDHPVPKLRIEWNHKGWSYRKGMTDGLLTVDWSGDLRASGTSKNRGIRIQSKFPAPSSDHHSSRP